MNTKFQYYINKGNFVAEAHCLLSLFISRYLNFFFFLDYRILSMISDLYSTLKERIINYNSNHSAKINVMVPEKVNMESNS